MQLESYIDRLNSAIEGLESEQLTVTNNIINLKVEYNQEKMLYDDLMEKISEESKKYSNMVMQYARMTYTQNKDILDEIDKMKKQSLERKKELDNKESELCTKMSEICEKDMELEEKDMELKEKAKTISRQEKDIAQQIVTQTYRESKITAQIQVNKEKTIELSIKSLALQKTEEKLEKEKEIFAKQVSLSTNAYKMKVKDLERREMDILKEKQEISSQWRTIKQAKAHIDNLKQGNQ